MLEQNFPPPTVMYTEARTLAERHLLSPQTSDATFKQAWDALAKFGLFRMPFDERLGGLGISPDDLCDVLEGLGAGGADGGLLLSAGAHLWAVLRPLVDFGTDAQRERWLPGLFAGSLMGAHAVSEPGAGSDVMSMTTRYTRDDADYRLQGSKLFITNAPTADLFLVFATSDPRLHFRGVSAFLVGRDAPGLSVGPPESKMGLEASPLATVYLDDCAVSAAALLGQERQGARIFQAALSWERTFIAAHQVGAMRRQIERAVEHARERRQFGVPIGQFQAVSGRIVEMYLRYWHARLVLRMAASALMIRGESHFASMAKLVLTEAALATHLDALRTFGGSGYMREQGIEQEVRDAIGGTLHSGTSDVQRNILAAALGL